MAEATRPSPASSVSDRARVLDEAARAIDWDHAPGCFSAALEILRDPDCSLGTASHLFWAAQPQEVQHRALADVDRENEPASQCAVVREVLLGVADQKFGNSIAYDPASEWDLAESAVPPALVRATPGAEPVVWRRQEDIESMWDDELANAIDNATDAEELFSIAMFLDKPAPLEAVRPSRHRYRHRAADLLASAPCRAAVERRIPARRARRGSPALRQADPATEVRPGAGLPQRRTAPSAAVEHSEGTQAPHGRER